MNTIKTLVVGYGLSARAFHLPFLQTNGAFEVVGIVQARGQEAQQDLPHLKHFNNLDDALDGTNAELVVISAPNEFHASMARQALLAGKHVLVEKPFTVTVNEAEELCQLAESNKKLLSVYHNRRWDGDFLTIKKILKEGIIGRPVAFISHFDRFRPQIKEGWKEDEAPGSGILYNLGPHLVDQALQLWGWPKSVYAHLRTERANSKVLDAIDLFLYYPNLTVKLSAGSLVSAPLPRFVVLGTEGSYTKWGMDPQEERLVEGQLPDQPGWGEEAAENWGQLVQGDNDSLRKKHYKTEAGNYNGFFEQLGLAINQKGPNPVPAHEALQVMKILMLAMKSEQEGRRISCG